MKKRDDNANLSCSFCGKSQKEVKKLIAGPTVYICDECIELCNDIIAEEYGQEEGGTTPQRVLKPKEIKAALDEYVIGQDAAKKVLSVAVHNHYKPDRYRASAWTTSSSRNPTSSLLGPTGSREKPYWPRPWPSILERAILRSRMRRSLTEAGYVGEDVENVIVNLLQAADG